MSNKKILVGMVLINLVGMISGLLRDSSITYALGATALSDVFIFTINLPTTLFSTLGWVIMSTFVPTYTEVRMNKSVEETNRFSNTFIKVMILIAAVIVVGLCVFNKQSVSILAPGFAGESFELARKLFIIIVPSLIFLTMTSCVSAILNSHKKLIWVYSIGIPLNIITILSVLYIYPIRGIEAATIFVLIGSVLQLFIVFIPLFKTEYKVTLDFDIKNSHIRNIVTMIGPMFIGIMAQQINVMFGSAVTSTLDSGSLTAYSLSTKVVNLAYNSIILIGISYIFPYLIDDLVNNERNKFREKIKSSINVIILILVPITVLFIVLNKEIIAVLYGYGNFTKEAINLTGLILIYSSIGIISLGIRELVFRAYYALKDTKTPMKYSVIGIVINIVIVLLLVKKAGVIGVAIGNTVSIIISSLLIWIKAKKDFEIESVLSYFDIFKYVIISGILVIISKYIALFASNHVNTFFVLIITGTITMIVYLLLAFFMKLPMCSLEYIKGSKKHK